MSKTIKIGHKKQTRQNFDDGVKGTKGAVASSTPVSGGIEIGSDAFNGVQARHERQYDESGNTQKVSGNTKTKLAEKGSASSGYQLPDFMTNNGKRGSVGSKSSFARYSRKPQSGE